MEVFCFVFINLGSSRDVLQEPAILWGLLSWQKKQLSRGQTRACFLPCKPAETFHSQTEFQSFSLALRLCSLIKCNTLERLPLKLLSDLLYKDELRSTFDEQRRAK